MQIKYGIASYHRPNCPTLKTLKELGVEEKNIVVSLNDGDDYRAYKEKYKGTGIEVIYKEGNNVACNRNNIINHFDIGERVMVLDDDIYAFKVWRKKEGSKYGAMERLSKKTFEMCLNECFDLCQKHKISFFGTYAIENTMLISSTMKKDGKYSVNKMFQGGCSGFIVDKWTRYNDKMLLLDDYEIILNQISKGRYVFRRNDIVACTPKMGSSEGGYFDIYKQGKQKEYLKILREMYPNLVTIKKDYSGIILKRNNGKRH